MAYLIAAFGAAFVATLALASLLTPARWWRRPNLKALTLLGAGTWGIGSVLLALAPAPAVAHVEAASTVRPLMVAAPAAATYVVFDDLNLRAHAGVQARRLALVPSGATVTTTGVREGDWWQVRASVGGRPVEGWVSSLWLRRAGEAEASSPARR